MTTCLTGTYQHQPRPQRAKHQYHRRSPRTTTKNGKEQPLFYTSISTDRSNNVPSPVVDSTACPSVVNKKALDNIMRNLAIKELKDEKICRSEHQFSMSWEPRKTFCAVGMPFQFPVKGRCDPVRFILYLMSIVAICHFSLVCHHWIQLEQFLTLDSIVFHWSSTIPFIASIQSIFHHMLTCRSKGPVITPVSYQKSRSYPKPPHKPQNISTGYGINIIACLVQRRTQ